MKQLIAIRNINMFAGQILNQMFSSLPRYGVKGCSVVVSFMPKSLAYLFSFLMLAGLELFCGVYSDGTYSSAVYAQQLEFDKTVPFGTEDIRSLKLGDIDGDGALDIIAGNFQQMEREEDATEDNSIALINMIYFNDGFGNYSIANSQYIGNIADKTFSVGLGDINGDGRLDAVFGNRGTNRLFTNLNAENLDETSGIEWGNNEDTYAVQLGDVDSDGALDIITANDGQNKIYRNDGLGGFIHNEDDGACEANLAVICFGRSNDRSYSISLGDIDSDGDLDIAEGRQGTIVVYHGDGSGHFDNLYQQELLVGPDKKVLSLHLVDVNGDAHLDLISSTKRGENRVFYNDGLGRFNILPSTSFGTGGDVTYDLAVADLNNDGRIDVITANRWRQNFIYLNDGDGQFTASTEQCDESESASAVCFNSGSDSALTVEAGDVDNDGDLDIVTGNDRQYGTVSFSNGASHHNEHFVFPFGAGNDGTRSLALGDIDNNGVLDIVTGNYHLAWTSTAGLINQGETNTVFMNAGPIASPGSSGLALDSMLDEDKTLSIALGDLNGDDRLDILAGNYNWLEQDGEQNFVYFNESDTQENEQWTPNFIKSPLGGLDTKTTDIVLADIDRDDDLDIIAASDGGFNYVYYNDGSGGFETYSAAAFGTGQDNSWTLTVGDVDKDNDLDILVGNYNLELVRDGTIARSEAEGQQNVIYLNQNGQFHSGPIDCLSTSNIICFGTGTDNTSDLALADLNGNGYLDIIIGNDYGHANMIVPNDGRGNYILTDSYNLGNAVNWTRELGTADIDNDGDLDIVVTSRETLREHITYLNDGVGGFHKDRSLKFGPGNDNTWGLDIGDIDQDGFVDIVLGNAYNESANLESSDRFYSVPQNQVYLNTFSKTSGVYSLPQLSVSSPLSIATSSTSSFPRILDQNEIPFEYTLFESEGLHAAQVAAEYSTTGGGHWQTARSARFVPLKFPIGHQIRVADLYTAPLTINAGDMITSTILITPQERIDDIEIWFSIEHSRTESLDLSLITPFGVEKMLANEFSDIGQIFLGTVIRPSAQVPISSENSPSNGVYRPLDNWEDLIGQSVAGEWKLVINNSASLTETGRLLGWGMRIATEPPKQTYIWDTFASGFFGQSDNVVLRIIAYPIALNPASVGTYRYPNQVAKPLQQAYISATTFPFRVRGTQARVIQNTPTDELEVMTGAFVYHLESDQIKDGQPLGPSIQAERQRDSAYRTNLEGYLQGQSKVSRGDQLLGVAPVTSEWWIESPWLQNPLALTKSLTDTVKLYYTNGAPTEMGIETSIRNVATEVITNVVIGLGVQQLEVSADNPLLLFDLNVALEWDASTDPNRAYLNQLESDLLKASEYIYDFTNGQAALGHITVTQNAENWAIADVIIQATNRLRPYAVQGGIVLTPTVDAQNPDVIYETGHVRMGASWNRYGNPGQSLGEDWPLTLAHELAHYLFFLEDTYLGIQEVDGQPILVPTNACEGSVMGDMYDPSGENTEFLTDEQWSACDETLANVTLGRSEWATIKQFYPMLKSPDEIDFYNPGPSLMPFNLTEITVLDPTIETINDQPLVTLPDTIFYLDYADNAPSSASARAYLLKKNFNGGEDFLIDLGAPEGGQNRLLVRGASVGDRLCIVDPQKAHFGCEIVSETREWVHLLQDASWQPDIRVTPITSSTIKIDVANVNGIDAPLKARVFQELVEASPELELINDGTGIFSAVYTATAAITTTIDGITQSIDINVPLMVGHLQLWVDENDTTAQALSETFVDFRIGGNPGSGPAFRWSGPAFRWSGPAFRWSGPAFRWSGPAFRWSGPAFRWSGTSQRNRSAPVVSADGQMIFFTRDFDEFEVGDLYTVQSSSVPNDLLPAGKRSIGLGYRLVGSESLRQRVIPGSISFQYLGTDALSAGITEEEEESLLQIHYYDEVLGLWQALNTIADADYNFASAASQGGGLYALLAGKSQPVVESLSDAWLYSDVSTVITLTGEHFLPPAQIMLTGRDGITLPLTAHVFSTNSLTTTIPLTLSPQSYQIDVINGDEMVASAPMGLSMLPPLQTNECFADIFESGVGQWQRTGEWDIVELPDGRGYAMTDSPSGTYNNAPPTQPRLVTHITSPPFNLLDCPNAALTFRHAFVIAAQESVHQDSADVLISRDNTDIWESLLETPYQGTSHDESRAESLGVEWTNTTLDEVMTPLSAFNSDLAVRLRFQLTVDQQRADKGWLLDDISVRTVENFPDPTPEPPPTAEPTATAELTVVPSATTESTVMPTAMTEPTVAPTATAEPTVAPTATVELTVVPTATTKPTATTEPTVAPTATPEPTVAPTATPEPTVAPTATTEPTVAPTPTTEPTVAPTPTTEPTVAPTATVELTVVPTATTKPTATTEPTVAPTATPEPTVAPTATTEPTVVPTATTKPTATTEPTVAPTSTAEPTTTTEPTVTPTATAELSVTTEPTLAPTATVEATIELPPTPSGQDSSSNTPEAEDHRIFFPLLQ